MAAAVFCERAIEDKEGVLSLIRVVDKFSVMPLVPRDASSGPIPEQMPPVPLHITMVLMLKSGNASGNHEVQFLIEDPSGETKALPEAPVPVLLTEGGGTNLTVALQLDVHHTGMFWVHVLVDGRELTEMPLDVVIQWPLQEAVRP